VIAHIPRSVSTTRGAARIGVNEMLYDLLLHYHEGNSSVIHCESMNEVCQTLEDGLQTLKDHTEITYVTIYWEPPKDEKDCC
jgi:hypothetical protein